MLLMSELFDNFPLKKKTFLYHIAKENSQASNCLLHAKIKDETAVLCKVVAR